MVLITHTSWLCECVSAFFTQRLTDIVFFLWVYFSWGCGEKAHISYCISSVWLTGLCNNVCSELCILAQLWQIYRCIIKILTPIILIIPPAATGRWLIQFITHWTLSILEELHDWSLYSLAASQRWQNQLHLQPSQWPSLTCENDDLVLMKWVN